MGSAPSAKILAIRAFGVTQGTAESASFTILKSLDYAAAHGAQIINMSFAGPKDALVSRGIAAAAAKSIVMVAASGNAGPKSPPLHPAAGYIAFFTALLFLIAVAALPGRSAHGTAMVTRAGSGSQLSASSDDS